MNFLHSGVYASAWRLPEIEPRAFVDVAHYVGVAKIAERGKFDAIFLRIEPRLTERIDLQQLQRFQEDRRRRNPVRA